MRLLVLSNIVPPIAVTYYYPAAIGISKKQQFLHIPKLRLDRTSPFGIASTAAH
jgi:hypothetical protein